ncbi:MAG: hypothetical protein HF981_19525 [Desulfobacteraceae bacterium]|nr:hypothetical protein [Desulfobacteraceae bacterium]MBC2752592.1 hypothetical protein [Desulfobacteraceae bacterium]
MNRALLEKPFGPEQIKQREGSFGKMLDYIEAHSVIQRLNDAFDGEWSFTVTKHEILKETDEVVVIGQLNAGGIVKSHFGSSRITRSRESGEMISLADDLKAAATDALKKCATLLGVGLHLYSGNNGKSQNGNGAHHHGNSSAAGGNGNRKPADNGGNGNNRPSRSDRNGGNGNGNGRLTSKQYRYILKLNEEHGRTKVDLDQQCLEIYGTVAQHLSKADASVVIENLLSR